MERCSQLFIVEEGTADIQLYNIDPNLLMFAKKQDFTTEVQISLMQDGYQVFIGFHHMIAFIMNPFGMDAMVDDLPPVNKAYWRHE